MKQLTSTHNPTIKKIRQLTTSSKARYKFNQTVLEGIHLCQGYLSSGGKPEVCLITEEALSIPEVAEIVAKCRQLDIEPLSVSSSVFSTISTVENGVGILMSIDIPNVGIVQQITRSAVLLDRIQDPGNAGTILRTTAASGITQAYFSQGSADAWSPKVLRAAMGAHFHLSIYQQVLLDEIITRSEISIYATSLSATQSIYEADLTRDAAWLMGNEGQGVDQQLMDLPNVKTVIIPQSPDVESLNVAAAAAVCLFEHRRQRENKT